MQRKEWIRVRQGFGKIGTRHIYASLNLRQRGKKIRFLNALVTAVLASILLNACFKPTYDYVYIDQEVKDYCVFGEGSYWIYQDSITNNLDSVMLMQSLLKMVEEHRGEWLAHNFMVEYHESKYWHYLSDTSVFLSSYPEPYLPIIIFNSGIQDCEKNIILRISPIDIYAPSSNLTSYTIGENIFNDVKILFGKDVIRREISGFCSAKFYWTKNIGLIRYEIYNSNDEILNTYNLIKYNVKPYKK